MILMANSMDNGATHTPQVDDKRLTLRGINLLPISKSKRSQQVVPPKKKDGDGESTTLHDFREVLKDVLQDITSLEITTVIVREIRPTRFDAREFYEQLIKDLTYKTEEGLQQVKDSLLERSDRLKQRGRSLPQPSAMPLLPDDMKLIAQYREDLDLYNYDLEVYKQAEKTLSDRLNNSNELEQERFRREQECYRELGQQLSKLEIPLDDKGRVIADASMVRFFRELWEYEQSIIKGERIYAQTRFQLDGDLTNRFIDDLFASSNRIEPRISQLILDLHRQGVENAEKQWAGLINTCLNLIQNLMPFRK